ncbi:MAG: shikimate kinase [Candidatus Zapsychrus exili]|nr:shikimate kinase [Candidatus Zapsychrus exili]
MQDKNISLVGFMGAGKSLISKELGKLLDREIISSDDLIEKKEGKKVAKIFEDSGEQYFRKIEGAVIEKASKMKNVIIDCGGGVVLNSKNISNLKKGGILVYLSATADAIYSRVKDEKHRPLLNVKSPRKKIKELLAARTLYYKQANYIIETDNKEPKQICAEIIKLLSDE